MGCHCLVHGAKHSFWAKSLSSFVLFILFALSLTFYKHTHTRIHTHTHLQLKLNTRGRNYSLQSASSVRTKSRIIRCRADPTPIFFKSSCNAKPPNPITPKPGGGGTGSCLPPSSAPPAGAASPEGLYTFSLGFSYLWFKFNGL